VSPGIHHIRPAISITDTRLAMRENEDRIGHGRSMPVSRDEFQGKQSLSISVLFDNRKSLLWNIFHISLFESIFWSLKSM
jgi:hypothetical protein